MDWKMPGFTMEKKLSWWQEVEGILIGEERLVVMAGVE
jgi:hypothetical protein